MSTEALQKAIKLAGNQSKLGEKVGKSQAHVSIWLTRDKKAPADVVLKIEKEVGVPRHELRPDIYPPDEYKPLLEVLGKKAA